MGKNKGDGEKAVELNAAILMKMLSEMAGLKPDGCGVTILLECESDDTVRKLDEELYVRSHGSADGFVAGDEVVADAHGIKVKVFSSAGVTE